MDDREGSIVNGSTDGAALPSGESRSLGDHGRRIRRDAAALAAEVRDTTADLEHFIAQQVEQRPYLTLGVAAGIGFALGGGIGSRLSIVLFSAVSRIATAVVVREVSARLLPPLSVDANEPEPVRPMQHEAKATVAAGS